MTKPVQFRAWSIAKKEMIYPVCVMFCPNELREWRVFTSSDGKFLGNDKHYEIMQFIGLTDKNGKEIYEGDVVRGGKDHGTIVWYADLPGWAVKQNDGEIYRLFPQGYTFEITEIIGNIYENPELLHG